MSKMLTLGAIAALSLAATAANATTFVYERGAGTFGGSGGTYSGVTATYNDVSEQLTWEVDDAGMAGAWLVVNGGPNPKVADENEFAIFFMDFVQDRLAVYAYNGQNNANSWIDPGIYLGDYSSSLITGTSQGFSLDATLINSANVQTNGPDWQGASFGDSIGIWFHPVWSLNAIYGTDGSIAEWNFGDQSWLDLSYQNTRRVPEPATLGLFFAGLVGASVLRRRAA